MRITHPFKKCLAITIHCIPKMPKITLFSQLLDIPSQFKLQKCKIYDKISFVKFYLSNFLYCEKVIHTVLCKSLNSPVTVTHKYMMIYCIS